MAGNKVEICGVDTSKLPTLSHEKMRELLKKLRDKGTTVLIASHYAGDIDELCDTVVEMEAGKMKKLL